MRVINLNINSLIRSLILIWCAVLLFSLSARGQTKPETISDFSAPVRKDVKATYFDLIDLVFPKTGENTRKSVPLNNIFGDYQAKVYEGNLQINYARSIWVNYNGRKHLLLLLNVRGDGAEEMFLWHEMTVLALFDLKGGLRLIDAIDVQGDRLAFFSELPPPVWNISPQADAFLIANHHFNAGESYMNLTLVSVVKNRFKVVLGDIPTLKEENRCGFSYEEKAALQINPHPGKTYRGIMVDFKRVRIPNDECGRKVSGYTKNYRYRYAWDEKRREYVKLKERK